MQRRKFLIGMGSLAAGGSAAIGTGAFTSVTADRNVDVQIAEDAQAYLSIQRTDNENSKKYVTGDPSSDTVTLDFSASNSNSNLGSGFNKNAVTEVDELLKVKNKGTQTIYFHVDIANLDLSDGTDVTIEAVQGNSNKQDNIAVDTNGSGGGKDVKIEVGDSVTLDIIVDTTGVSASPPLEDPDGFVTLNADTKDGVNNDP